MKGLEWVLFAIVLAVVGLASTSASASPSSSGRVRNRERAKGVYPVLQTLLDDWEREGTHDVEISPMHGGVRWTEDVQRELAGDGMSAADTLEKTPHGRAAALDIWPIGFAQYVNGRWEDVPAEIRARFQIFGEWAERKGFVWGGRFHSSTYPNGDQPHVEIRAWRTLPFPPQAGGYS